MVCTPIMAMNSQSLLFYTVVPNKCQATYTFATQTIIHPMEQQQTSSYDPTHKNCVTERCLENRFLW